MPKRTPYSHPTSTYPQGRSTYHPTTYQRCSSSCLFRSWTGQTIRSRTFDFGNSSRNINEDRAIERSSFRGWFESVRCAVGVESFARYAKGAPGIDGRRRRDRGGDAGDVTCIRSRQGGWCTSYGDESCYHGNIVISACRSAGIDTRSYHTSSITTGLGQT